VRRFLPATRKNEEGEQGGWRTRGDGAGGDDDDMIDDGGAFKSYCFFNEVTAMESFS